jgi:hypothetical protein
MNNSRHFKSKLRHFLDIFKKDWFKIKIKKSLKQKITLIIDISAIVFIFSWIWSFYFRHGYRIEFVNTAFVIGFFIFGIGVSIGIVIGESSK